MEAAEQRGVGLVEGRRHRRGVEPEHPCEPAASVVPLLLLLLLLLLLPERAERGCAPGWPSPTKVGKKRSWPLPASVVTARVARSTLLILLLP